jgi:hypothetical protein
MTTTPIAHGWYAEIEDYQADAPLGQRFLARRQYRSYRDKVMIVDYITVRREYGGWEHVTALYLQDEPSPFGVPIAPARIVPPAVLPLSSPPSAVPAPPSSPRHV